MIVAVELPSSIRLLIHSFIYLLIYSFIHSFISILFCSRPYALSGAGRNDDIDNDDDSIQFNTLPPFSFRFFNVLTLLSTNWSCAVTDLRKANVYTKGCGSKTLNVFAQLYRLATSFSGPFNLRLRRSFFPREKRTQQRVAGCG